MPGAIACAKGDAAAAGAAAPAATPAHVDPAHGTALTPGTYTVQSAARHRGDTLRLTDNGIGSYSAQLVVPNGGGLYQGTGVAMAGDSIELHLLCSRCRTGTDGFGQPAYEDVSYDGRYRVRALGGGRLELRRTDGPAVDTLARDGR